MRLAAPSVILAMAVALWQPCRASDTTTVPVEMASIAYGLNWSMAGYPTASLRADSIHSMGEPWRIVFNAPSLADSLPAGAVVVGATLILQRSVPAQDTIYGQRSGAMAATIHEILEEFAVGWDTSGVAAYGSGRPPTYVIRDGAGAGLLYWSDTLCDTPTSSSVDTVGVYSFPTDSSGVDSLVLSSGSINDYLEGTHYGWLIRTAEDQQGKQRTRRLFYTQAAAAEERPYMRVIFVTDVGHRFTGATIQGVTID